MIKGLLRLIFFSFFFAGGVLFGQTSFPVLKPGETLKDEVPLLETGISYKTYILQVPSTAYALSLILVETPADLDLFIRHGEEMSSYDEADFSGTSTDFNEELFVTRLTGSGLKPGIYYLDVAYQLDDPPVIEGKPVTSVPFQLSYSLINARVDASLSAGEAVKGVLKPEEGMFRTYKLTVPPGAEALRLDLFDVDFDLDIFVSRDSPLLERSSMDHKGVTLFARESLVIDGTSSPPLRAGTYFVTVVDQVSQSMDEPFSLSAVLSPEPPEFLKALPRLASAEPPGSNPVQHALDATVQIVARDGTGSGTLLSREGLILTNYHVIELDSGEPQEEVGVAMNLDNSQPPRELFKAEVLYTDEDRDLALLKIRKGLYDQPLPPGYRFPWIPLGRPEDMTIADPLVIIGYPGIGGSSSRVSITYTRGIVSGYERSTIGLILKTDAVMNYGNSGGAALNSRFELIGVPSSVINEEAGQLGYVHPVNLLPSTWLEMIRREQR